MLENFLHPQLNELAADVEDIWFQQNGATVHTAQKTMRYLRELFPRHISHRGDIPWPARPPDLAPCDFLHWGYLKGEVYNHRPRNLVELKTAIREEIQQIKPAMIVRVIGRARISRHYQILKHASFHARSYD